MKTFEAILDNDDITMIDICTPSFKHKDMVIASAKKGKNVFCENRLLYQKKMRKRWLKAARIMGENYGDNFNHYLVRDFIETIKEHRTPFTTGNDGLQSLKVALTAYESAKNKRWLKV